MVKKGKTAVSMKSFHILFAYSSTFGIAKRIENTGKSIERTIKSAVSLGYSDCIALDPDSSGILQRGRDKENRGKTAPESGS